MRKTACLIPFFLLALSTPAPADTYRGQVGKLKAVFDLDWGGDNSVGGTYHYPSRPGVVYTLEGEFGADRKLVLREYTRGTLTAVLFLSPSGKGGKVRWSGTMKNTDGREFQMWFGE